MYDLSGLNAAYAGTWDASIGRNDPPVFERNPAPSTSLYSTAGFGFVDGISKDLLLGPPTLVRAQGLRTIGRGPFKGEPVWRTSTFAIDRGRITGYVPLPALGPTEGLAASIRMYKGSPTGGLTFRVGLRDVSGGAPVETVLFEHTMRMGDATVPVRVGPFGAVAPGSALFVEIEAVGSGIGEVGIFHRLAVGTPEELDRFTGWVTSSINVLRTEAAAVARPKMPPTNYRFVQPVFLDEPDDPYELSLTYVVDGRGVSDALSAAPRRPARVTNATAAGAERDLGIAEPRQGPHAMVYDFGGWPIPGGTESGGWAGGVQPGATVSTLPASFDIAGMGGDGEVGASWLGVVKVLVEDDPTKLLGDAAVAVRDAFVAALEAELEAVLPVAGTRTGLTLAEAKAVVAKVDSIAASVVSAAVLPKLGAQPAGDDLVGVVHEAFFVDELRDGGATRVDIITGASGSSYRVVIAAS